MSTRVLVTGAAGRLGREVCSALVEAGYEVRATDRVWRSEMPVPLELADLRDYLPVYRLVDGCGAVVHLANHPGPGRHVPAQQIYSENVATDVNVFQAAVEVGVRKLVFASSVQVLAGDRHVHHGDEEALSRPSCLAYLPIDGEAPTCPRNTYALSKEAGEQQLKYYAAMEAELSATAIRYPFLLVERHLEWIRRHRERHGGFWGNPDEGFSYLAVSDAATLVAAVLDRQPPGYHQLFPAAPDYHLEMPLAEAIAKFYPGAPLKKPVEEMTGLVDISAITEALGWRPKRVNIFAEEVEI